MEYDRALYRVYDRVMEELISSPPPAPTTTQPLPFFLPLWFSRLMDDPSQFLYHRARRDSDPFLLPSSSSLALTSEAAADDPSSLRRRRDSHGNNPASPSSSSGVQQSPSLILPANSSNSSTGGNSHSHSLSLTPLETEHQPDSTARQSGANPLYSHHARRMRMRLSANRRSVTVPAEDLPSATHRASRRRASSSASSSSSVSSNDSTPSVASDAIVREVARGIQSARMRSIPTMETIPSATRGGGCRQMGCWKLLQLCAFLGFFHLAALTCLHVTYVRTTGGCIDYALQTRGVGDPPVFLLHDRKKDSEGGGDDEDLDREKLTGMDGVLVDGSQKGVKKHAAQNISMDVHEEEEEEEEEDVRDAYLGDNEILQLKVLYAGYCTGQCSRVRWINRTENDADKNVWDGKCVEPLNSEEYWEKIHYRFSTSEAILYLDDELVRDYNITLVNVTVTEKCLSTGSDQGRLSFTTRTAQILAQIYGMDAVIINNLMFGLFDRKGNYRNGYLQNTFTGERWSWRKHMLPLPHNQTSTTTPYSLIGNLWAGFWNKVGILFLSLLSFYLITSITALIVRVLTSSGVVLMFPLFSLFRRFGVPNADDRILSLSYPWIGRALAQIESAGIQPSADFIGAHFSKIFLYYCMYEASEAAWSVVLYGKSVPESLPIWIYGFAMIWEYFCMVFVRSSLSVHFFPKITLCYFVIYHIYFYNYEYAFFDVALLPLFFFMAHAMIYTVLALEVPAVSRGVISMECPREVYSRLSWSVWSADLPAEWTLFLPLNSRYTPLYDMEVGGDNTNEEDSDDDDQSSVSEEEVDEEMGHY